MAAPNSVYVNTSNDSSSPISAHHDFSHFYTDSPVEAARSYALSMHQHTKKQMDAATRSCRRRQSSVTSDDVHSLEHEESVSSMESDRSWDFSRLKAESWFNWKCRLWIIKGPGIPSLSCTVTAHTNGVLGEDFG